MYLNLGGDITVCEKDVIGVFDMDKLTVFKTNRNYLSNKEKEGKIVNIMESLPKSFVVCEENGEEKTYISPLLPATLLKRSEEDGR